MWVTSSCDRVEESSFRKKQYYDTWIQNSKIPLAITFLFWAESIRMKLLTKSTNKLYGFWIFKRFKPTKDWVCWMRKQAFGLTHFDNFLFDLHSKALNKSKYIQNESSWFDSFKLKHNNCCLLKFGFSWKTTQFKAGYSFFCTLLVWIWNWILRSTIF